MKEGETIMDNYLTENIDTVIFDIGNVLIHFAWEDYLHDLGYEGAMFDRVADAVFRSDDWDKGDSGLYTTQEWLDSFIENDPEIEGDIRKVFEGFGASIVPYPVTERWLSYIREKGMKMYYLSNYSDRNVLSVRGAIKLFENISRRGIFLEGEMYEAGSKNL